MTRETRDILESQGFNQAAKELQRNLSLETIKRRTNEAWEDVQKSGDPTYRAIRAGYYNAMASARNALEME